MERLGSQLNPIFLLITNSSFISADRKGDRGEQRAAASLPQKRKESRFPNTQTYFSFQRQLQKLSTLPSKKGAV